MQGKEEMRGVKEGTGMRGTGLFLRGFLGIGIVRVDCERGVLGLKKVNEYALDHIRAATDFLRRPFINAGYESFINPKPYLHFHTLFIQRLTTVDNNILPPNINVK